MSEQGKSFEKELTLMKKSNDENVETYQRIQRQANNELSERYDKQKAEIDLLKIKLKQLEIHTGYHSNNSVYQKSLFVDSPVKLSKQTRRPSPDFPRHKCHDLDAVDTSIQYQPSDDLHLVKAVEGKNYLHDISDA